ncbi:MAG: DUF3078 domain-containing protein [Bacteroidia bacterium]|nr:DUF3078 domain-containing protein [Bacteroidia bacterium]
MKTIRIFIALFLLGSGMANAQSDTLAKNDTIWRTGGLFSSAFNQVSLTNWAAGGQNAIALNNLVSLFAKYKKGKIAWDNNLDMGYGILKQGDEKVRKNDDRLEFNSKLGIDAYKAKVYYTLLFNFRSQFAPGYNYPRNDTTRYISKFAAPAFALLALGIDYKPVDYFSVFLSPATARLIIVNDDSLSKAGAYGVDPGDKVRSEIGAYLNTRFQKDILKDVNFMTKLDLFSNYKDSPQNIDVNWEILLSVKVNRFIAMSLGTQLIYDDNTAITIFKDQNGIKVPELNVDGTQRTGPRTQFRQVFGIGLTYKVEGFTVR